MGATNKPVYCSPLPVCSNFEPLQGCSGECRAPSRDIIAGINRGFSNAEKSFLLLGLQQTRRQLGWSHTLLVVTVFFSGHLIATKWQIYAKFALRRHPNTVVLLVDL